MSGVIPLPPECFSLGKSVLEAGICSSFPPRASFSSIPLDQIRFLGLHLFFTEAGHYKVGSVQYKQEK